LDEDGRRGEQGRVQQENACEGGGERGEVEEAGAAPGEQGAGCEGLAGCAGRPTKKKKRGWGTHGWREQRRPIGGWGRGRGIADQWVGCAPAGCPSTSDTVGEAVVSVPRPRGKGRAGNGTMSRVLLHCSRVVPEGQRWVAGSCRADCEQPSPGRHDRAFAAGHVPVLTRAHREGEQEEKETPKRQESRLLSRKARTVLLRASTGTSCPILRGSRRPRCRAHCPLRTRGRARAGLGASQRQRPFAFVRPERWGVLAAGGWAEGPAPA
jgi:hypothetical protein